MAEQWASLRCRAGPSVAGAGDDPFLSRIPGIPGEVAAGHEVTVGMAFLPEQVVEQLVAHHHLAVPILARDHDPVGPALGHPHSDLGTLLGLKRLGARHDVPPYRGETAAEPAARLGAIGRAHV